jgi:hypothetical protein
MSSRKGWLDPESGGHPGIDARVGGRRLFVAMAAHEWPLSHRHRLEAVGLGRRVCLHESASLDSRGGRR